MNGLHHETLDALTREQCDQLKRRMADVLLGPAATEDQRAEVGWVHVVHRVNEARNYVVPWLETFMPMKGAQVLEIGAGTGSRVLAMVEAGAVVHGIDILADHLELARERLEVHGEPATLEVRNASDIADLGRSYDLILFSATLEHMTYAERIESLSAAWGMLHRGGVLAVYETPNRLWFRDDHTAQLPYFHWLPDELAIIYAKRSARADFSAAALDAEQLARWGRGASYHEFELALPLADAVLGETYQEFQRRKFEHVAAAWAASPEKRYYDLLGELTPGLAGAWREEVLGFMLRKP